MAATQKVTFIVSARDRTRAVFRKIGDGFKRMGRAASQIGGILTGIFVVASKSALTFASSMQAAALQTKVSAETLQGLEIVATDVGVQFEQLQTVIRRLGTNAGAAATGNDKLREAFERLGVTTEQLETLDREGLLLALANGVRDFNGSAVDLQNTLRTIGDTEAIRAIPLLEQGADAIREQIALLKERGIILGNEDIARGAQTEAQVRRELLVLQRQVSRELLQLLAILTKTDADSITPGGIKATAEAVFEGSVANLSALIESAMSTTGVGGAIPLSNEDKARADARDSVIVDVLTKGPLITYAQKSAEANLIAANAMVDVKKVVEKGGWGTLE